MNVSASINQRKLRDTILRVTQLLVEGRYEELETLTEGKQLSAEQIAKAVEDWPSHVIMPPDDSLESLVYGILEVPNSHPEQWLVDAILYSEREGRSDLTPSLTLTDALGEYYQVALDDLHVL